MDNTPRGKGVVAQPEFTKQARCNAFSTTKTRDTSAQDRDFPAVTAELAADRHQRPGDDLAL